VFARGHSTKIEKLHDIIRGTKCPSDLLSVVFTYIFFQVFLCLPSAICLGTWPMSLFPSINTLSSDKHSTESQIHINVKFLGSEYGENKICFM
jgi:hypothetical protein